MRNQPARKCVISIWWTCGLPGCSHPTKEGATFHGIALTYGLPHIVTKPQWKPPREGEKIPDHYR